MNPALLESQFQTLEEPDDGLRIDIQSPPDEIVRHHQGATQRLKDSPGNHSQQSSSRLHRRRFSQTLIFRPTELRDIVEQALMAGRSGARVLAIIPDKTRDDNTDVLFPFAAEHSFGAAASHNSTRWSPRELMCRCLTRKSDRKIGIGNGEISTRTRTDLRSPMECSGRVDHDRGVKRGRSFAADWWLDQRRRQGESESTSGAREPMTRF